MCIHNIMHMYEYIIIATSFVAELACKYMSMVSAIYSYTCMRTILQPL